MRTHIACMARLVHRGAKRTAEINLGTLKGNSYSHKPWKSVMNLVFCFLLPLLLRPSLFAPRSELLEQLLSKHIS